MFRQKNGFRKLAAWAGLFLLLVAAAGCMQLPDTGALETPGDQEPLSGTQWVLVRLNDREPVPGTEVTLSFEETTAGGSTGCNSFGGDYETGPGGSLSFSELTQTLIACEEPEGVMDQESEYLDLLRLAATYRISGDQLEIQNAAGETVLVFDRQ